MIFKLNRALCVAIVGVAGGLIIVPAHLASRVTCVSEFVAEIAGKVKSLKAVKSALGSSGR